MKFIILSGSQELIGSIDRYLKYAHSIVDVDHFLLKNPEGAAYENFLVIKDWIESFFEDKILEMKQAVVFIDLPVYDFSDLMPTSGDEHGLAALLYLTFPEIYWIFMLPFSNKKSSECFGKSTFDGFHILFTEQNFKQETEGNEHKVNKSITLNQKIKASLYGYTPLFDPSGAREQIVRQTLQYMKNSGEDILSERPFSCKREEKAVVIDEELAYSYLHAYVGYKMGYRTMLVSTKAILDDVRELQKEAGSSFDISFEDICLSFPDHKITNDLAEREEENGTTKSDKTYSFFQKIRKRIFITIGERKKLKKTNREYRKKLKAEGKLDFYRILHKPYAGIFNLIESSKLKFKKIKTKNPNNENVTGHSAPGRFGLIADFLINRCKKVLAQANSSIDAVYAAMLALQAQEILGGRTATLSIEAISLKHQAEVKAECMFYGVEHNFDVKRRFKEIEDELNVIGRWFGKSKRDIMILNSELNIVNELARVFRNYSQFDEEQLCMEKVRTLSRKIYRKRNKIFGWLISPLRWYFEFLVGSLARFIAAIAFWPSLFTLIFYFIFRPANTDALKNAFNYSINAFFGTQITISGNLPDCLGLSILLIIPILLGFFHLGIFISHLYTIISRK